MVLINFKIPSDEIPTDSGELARGMDFCWPKVIVDENMKYNSKRLICNVLSVSKLTIKCNNFINQLRSKEDGF
jgi:hypothetical protein